MGRKDSNKGFTLMEMLVVIAIIAILASIAVFFYFRNLNRPKAILNASNLRGVRSILEAELAADPEHPEEVLNRVLSGAPGAVGMDTPEISVPNGTPMDAVIGEDGVDTFYNGYNAEDFENLYGNGSSDEEPPQESPEESPMPVYCGVLSCQSTDLVDGTYCIDHQLKTCGKSIKVGDTLAPCGQEYRDLCREAHYKLGPCPCKIGGSAETACLSCGHWHGRGTCPYTALVPDNSTESNG